MNKLTSNTILETAVFNLSRTAERLDLSPDVFAKIAEPREKIELTLTPVLIGNEMTIIKVFLVRHNDVLGPAKGGIRMTPTVTMDDITGLSMEMTWKTSLIAVPFGGGKAGIRFDPATVSPEAKEIVIRSFTRGVRRHIGPEVYIPAPDMGTNEVDMGHVRDCISYSNGTSITNGCFVTGKPVVLGGIAGRREATGKGVVYTTLEACDALGIDIKSARVAVQGFGNVGSVAADIIESCGAAVVAVSDVDCGLMNPDGIDIKSLIKHVRQNGSIKGFSGAVEIERDKVLEADCDILIPAAAQSQITGQNAGKIKAKIIAEGANSPTTPEGDDILNQRNVFIIPDILCNAGGVFVSYLEYTQETQREQMSGEQVEKRLSERMSNKFQEVYEYATDNGIGMRNAAMDIAVRRVVDGIYARGILP